MTSHFLYNISISKAFLLNILYHFKVIYGNFTITSPKTFCATCLFEQPYFLTSLPVVGLFLVIFQWCHNLCTQYLFQKPLFLTSLPVVRLFWQFPNYITKNILCHMSIWTTFFRIFRIFLYKMSISKAFLLNILDHC